MIISIDFDIKNAPQNKISNIKKSQYDQYNWLKYI